MSNSTGDEFHQSTKYTRGNLPRRPLDFSTKPSAYKFMEGTQRVSLPPPDTKNGPALWEILSRRRSIRTFSKEAMTQAQLAQLLWASQGITQPSVPAYGDLIGLRAAPSAGALYPIETYLIVNNVTDLDPGIYHYTVEKMELELIKKGSFGQAISEAALEQTMLASGNVVFVWTAVFERTKWKYRQRAYRYVFLDVGHIAQNLALAAEGLGLGSCPVGAFFDDEVNQLLKVDGKNESALYLSVVGCKKK